MLIHFFRELLEMLFKLKNILLKRFPHIWDVLSFVKSIQDGSCWFILCSTHLLYTLHIICIVIFVLMLYNIIVVLFEEWVPWEYIVTFWIKTSGVDWWHNRCCLVKPYIKKRIDVMAIILTSRTSTDSNPGRLGAVLQIKALPPPGTRTEEGLHPVSSQW